MKPASTRLPVFFNVALGPPEFLHDRLALGHRGGVAPELGGADDIAVFVERHEAVLLAGDADAGDGRAVDFLEDGEDDLVERFDPGGRVLLHVPDRAGSDPLGRARLGDDLAGLEVSTMALVLCVPLSMPMKRLMGWYWDLMGVADRAKPETNKDLRGCPAPCDKKRPRERTAASVNRCGGRRQRFNDAQKRAMRRTPSSIVLSAVA